ncbi:MAG: ABC transporter substrate-binding protein [Acidimicrobiia bacterium]
MRKSMLAIALSGALAVPLVTGSAAQAAAGKSTEPPKRIVSLSPTSTEMLFAIGAGKQVVAVDDQSNYPKNAPRTKLTGLQPNVEAIAGYHPDLVVMYDATVAPQLKKLGIATLTQPAAKTLDDTYREITALGTATGRSKAANALVATMKARIAAITKTVPRKAKTLSYYHELDNTYYTATSKTFIGSLYAKAKLRNVADPADTQSAGGYPQLSAEFVIEKDPDLVFLADGKCCQQSVATVAARPGWGALTAVRRKHVIVLDDDVASRWGPRVVELLRTIAQAANKARTS